jgi:hypothetical protein
VRGLGDHRQQRYSKQVSPVSHQREGRLLLPTRSPVWPAVSGGSFSKFQTPIFPAPAPHHHDEQDLSTASTFHPSEPESEGSPPRHLGLALPCDRPNVRGLSCSPRHPLAGSVPSHPVLCKQGGDAFCGLGGFAGALHGRREDVVARSLVMVVQVEGYEEYLDAFL